MRNLRHLLAFIFCLTLCSCSPTKKLNRGYFKTDKKVGLIFLPYDFIIHKRYNILPTDPLSIIPNIGISRNLNATKPNEELDILEAINKNHPDLISNIVKLFEEAHKRNGVNYKILDIDLSTLNLNEHTPTFMRKKQAKLDYRMIGQEHNIDFLLIVSTSSILKLGEITKVLRIIVSSNVINMVDNSYQFSSEFKNNVNFFGRWKEAPEYPNLMEKTAVSIQNVLKKIDLSINQ